ncbi:MAG: hypothetical protein HY814_07125 [Candidatus Riflebacteria bacterium]|nr:hypothetical protein [Candidatus Riflebacteria bacterium]
MTTDQNRRPEDARADATGSDTAADPREARKAAELARALNLPPGEPGGAAPDALETADLLRSIGEAPELNPVAACAMRARLVAAAERRMGLLARLERWWSGFLPAPGVLAPALAVGLAALFIFWPQPGERPPAPGVSLALQAPHRSPGLRAPRLAGVVPRHWTRTRPPGSLAELAVRLRLGRQPPPPPSASRPSRVVPPLPWWAHPDQRG